MRIWPMIFYIIGICAPLVAEFDVVRHGRMRWFAYLQRNMEMKYGDDKSEM